MNKYLSHLRAHVALTARVRVLKYLGVVNIKQQIRAELIEDFLFEFI